MCNPVAAVTAAVGALSAIQGQQQMKEQKKAAAQAQTNAEKQVVAAERDMNARNSKQPNTAAMASANQQAAQSGIGSTMLTGSQGVDPTSLVLGRNTLLGM